MKRQPFRLAEMIFVEEASELNRTDLLLESMELNEGIIDFFKNIGSFLKKAWQPAWSEHFDEELFREKGVVAPKVVAGQPFDDLDKNTKQQWVEKIGELIQTVQKATNDAKVIADAIKAFGEAASEGKKPEEATSAGFKEADVDPKAAVGDSRSARRLEKGLGKIPKRATELIERSFGEIKNAEDAANFLSWFIDQFPEEKSNMLKKAYREVKKEL